MERPTPTQWREDQARSVAPAQASALLLDLGDCAAAEEGFCAALAVARRQSAKLWERRAATSLAQLWRDQSKGIEARDQLAPIYGWFTEAFDTPVLQDAKALLDQLA